MKKLLIFSLLLGVTFLFGQRVFLSKSVKIQQSSDKFLYRIPPDYPDSEYLGEIEVQGFSSDDAATFGKIYKLAKELGANSFTWKPFSAIEGVTPFSADHYVLRLFYTPAELLPKEENTVYLLASPYKQQTISVNGEKITFHPRTYHRLELAAEEVYSISTRALLGSSVRLSAKDNQPVQYFQFSGFSVNSNPAGTPGINFKSGDIILLERSYAEFLTTVYQSF